MNAALQSAKLHANGMSGLAGRAHFSAFACSREPEAIEDEGPPAEAVGGDDGPRR